MRIGEIVREGERELPTWEPQREPVEPVPAPMAKKIEPIKPEKVSVR
jgi:hypothetical protein